MMSQDQLETPHISWTGQAQYPSFYQPTPNQVELADLIHLLYHSDKTEERQKVQ